jgi:hypothetical protein
LWENFKAWNKKHELKTCSSLEVLMAVVPAIESQIFPDILSENERQDRVERKREFFTHTFFTQTQNRDKRRLKNVCQNDGNLTAVGEKASKVHGSDARERRFYCALKDVWVERGGLPMVDCRDCPNRACRKDVFERVSPGALLWANTRSA